MTLVIEHTMQDGTVLCGTARGDGASEIVKPLGWRWGRQLGAWYLPRSRDKAAPAAAIEGAACGLRAAGFQVQVQVEQQQLSAEQRVEHIAAAEERREQRALDRAHRYEERAAVHSRTAHEHWAAEERLNEAYPFGQPILAGHHSQARHERDLERALTHLTRGVEHHHSATTASARAGAARATQSHRVSPETVGNRIAALEAQLRALNRRHDRAAAPQSAAPVVVGDLVEQIAEVQASLTYWNEHRRQAIAEGTAPDVGPHNVAVGDAVQVSTGWYEVVRVNAKSVTVLYDPDHGWTSRRPWHTIRGHRRRA